MNDTNPPHPGEQPDQSHGGAIYRTTTQELNGEPTSPLRTSSGWDGKLRLPNAERTATLVNPEALSDPDYSDPDAPPVEQIPPDEDLLDDEDPETEDIDLVHCRIADIELLQLERFKQLKRLCLRQNAIETIALPDALGKTLEELDLYDNLISSIRGLDCLTNLRTLDLSFNKIKHIKNLTALTSLKEMYFVQNRISQIENLEPLVNLTMIELAANRIREIQNLDRLTNLKELWLGKNKITSIKNLTSLTSLRLLDLKSNRLTSISGLETLTELEDLYVSHNAITEIGPESLRNNKKLRVLDISNNRITKLENISHLKDLEEFWASANGISNFREVEKELADKEKLETVYFEANPLQLNGPAVYRNKIRLALPQVRQIDATFVRM